MQYLLMCCIDENRWNAIPEAERDGVMREYGQWVRATTDSGHYRGGAKLRGTASATTLREKNGKPAMTDGPFAETKEQLLGFYVVDCPDQEEAMQAAKLIGGACNARTLEVRPIQLYYPAPKTK